MSKLRVSLTQLSAGWSWFKQDKVLLTVILLLAFWLRLKGLTNSVTDWHAFRQADTASVTREYIRHGIDLLHPRYQDLSNIQSGLDNLEGYRMVEFPIVNATLAIILRAMPSWDLVIVSRLASIVASLFTVVSLYWLGKIWSGKWVGVGAAFIFAMLPYAVFYSRVVMPEPYMVATLTWAILGFEKWVQTKKPSWYVVSLLSFILALLFKPFVLFMGLVWAVIAWQKWGWKVVKQWPLYVYVGIAIVPLWAWRHWIENFPSGIPANDWLFNGDGIRLRPAWFRWLFWERLTKLILGGIGVPFLALGALMPGKNWLKYLAWWLGVAAYLIVIATGNVRHDYYQVLLLPIICLSVARGGEWLMLWSLSRLTHFHRAAKKLQSVLEIGRVLILLVMAAALYNVANYYVRGYYSTRPDWETAGQAANELLPADAKVIAPAFGDTAFLFQTQRVGWPIGFEIPDKIAKGAEYYVTTSYDDEARALEQQYPTLAKTADYLIFDLRVPLATGSATPSAQIKK